MVTFNAQQELNICKIIGDLLKADLHVFYDKIENQLEEPAPKIIVDLSCSSPMNSGSLGQLVSLVKYMKSKNITVAIYCPDFFNLKHLKFIHMDELVKVYQDLNDAINYMQNDTTIVQ